MSFSLSLKQEILMNKPMRVRYKWAHAYGLFLFAREFSVEEILLRTENEEIARLFLWFAREILGRKTLFSQRERRLVGKTVYTVELPLAEDRLRLLDHFGGGECLHRERLDTPEAMGAFLSGAYLACGNITDPEKSYHMEFVTREEPLCRELCTLLEENVPGARITTRRQSYVCYYKECGPIEDLMTLMGATKSCLTVIDIEMFKNVRNQANRATNCETANIDKLVSAATSQVEDIRLIFDILGEDSLPDPLGRAARLRLDNPAASLRELTVLSGEGLSRSGLHHRLDKLSKIAAEIRTQTKEGAVNG